MLLFQNEREQRYHDLSLILEPVQQIDTCICSERFIAYKTDKLTEDYSNKNGSSNQPNHNDF